MKILFIILISLFVFLLSFFLFCALKIIPEEMEDEIGKADYDGTPDDDEEEIIDD